MAIHLKNVHIECYRGITDLELKNLNGINILTGDNNSGKTSILELLSTLQSPYSFETWNICAREPLRRGFRRAYFEMFYSLFPIDQIEKRLAFNVETYDKGSYYIELISNIYKTMVSEADINYINGYPLRKNENQTQDMDVHCMELILEINGEKTKLEELYDFQYRLRRVRNNLQSPIYSLKKHSIYPSIYITPFYHATHSTSLNNIASDKEMYDDLIEALREFEPGIVSIIATESKFFGITSDYRIMSDNHSEGIPLGVYGDGMKKAFSLMNAVLRAKHGLLLIDEFETSIHPSAMNKFFSWILKTAMKNDVQVFLTSHSQEAIEKVLNLDEEIKDNTNLYTLYNYDGKNTVRMMACREAIEASMHMGVDLR